MSVRAFNRDERCVMRKTREEKETSDESFFSRTKNTKRRMRYFCVRSFRIRSI